MPSFSISKAWVLSAASIQVALFSACDLLSKSSSSSTSSTAITQCSFEDTQVYSVLTDPTVSFTAYSVYATDTVTSTDCSGTYVGEVDTATVDSVIRSGSTLTVTNYGESNILTLTGGTWTANSQDLNGCSSGVQINGTLVSTTLNSTAHTVTLHFAWTLIHNGCSSLTGSSHLSATDPGSLIPSAPRESAVIELKKN